MSFSCPAGTVVRDSELEMLPVSAASEGNDSKAANNKVTDRKIPPPQKSEAKISHNFFIRFKD